MNRTPREILLERHRAVEVRLDAIRQRIMTQELHPADIRNTSARLEIARTFVRLPIRIWQELFWSCRRVWAGLAAFWLVMIAVNLVSLNEQPGQQILSHAAGPDIWTFLAERERVLAELGDTAPPSPPPPAVAPRPRSEYRISNRARC